MSPMQQLLLGVGAAKKKYIEDVFNQMDYVGNNGTQAIAQGFDYTTDGGMAIIKSATSSHGSYIATTEELNGDGSSKLLQTTMGNGWQNEAGAITLTSTGITLGDGGAAWNENNQGYLITSFKKTKGFIDIVKFSGNSNTRAISHGLGTVPGAIWLKRTSGGGDVGDFWVYHKNGTSSSNQYLSLRNNNSRQTDSPNLWDVSQMTATTFGLGTNSKTNGNGNDYIAILFSDGSDNKWGENADEPIIKCGVYTGNGSTNDNSPKDAGVGFEVSWHMNKNVGNTGGNENWSVLSSMHGYGGRMSTNRKGWYMNSNNSAFSNQFFGFNSRIGPQMWETNVNASGVEYMYLSIRRMGQKPIATANEAFTKLTYSDDSFAYAVPKGGFRLPTAWINANRTTGFLFEKRENSSNDYKCAPRLAGGKSFPFNKDDGYGNDGNMQFGGMGNSKNLNLYHKARLWPCVHGYFDVQEFQGENQTITVDHELGVVPDMVWIKCGAANMMVASPSIDNNGTDWATCLNLGTKQGSENMNKSNYDEQYYVWNNSVDPTSTTITLKGSTNANQYKWSNAISAGPPNLNFMYLFKMIPGISKIGRYSGNGASYGRSINCGFSNGIAFVVVKRVNGGGGGEPDWWCTDSEHIGSSNSEMGRLNEEDPWGGSTRITTSGNTGFKVKGDLNNSGSSWWYYAIAA